MASTRCRHIRVSGHRCTTPALDGNSFCFYHSAHRADAAARAVGYPPSPIRVPVLEDRTALQLAIHQVLEQVAAGTMHPKRGGTLLYGIQIAASLLPRPNAATPACPVPQSHPHPSPLAPQPALEPPPALATQPAEPAADPDLVQNPVRHPCEGLIAPEDPAPLPTTGPTPPTASAEPTDSIPLTPWIEAADGNLPLPVPDPIATQPLLAPSTAQEPSASESATARIPHSLSSNPAEPHAIAPDPHCIPPAIVWPLSPHAPEPDLSCYADPRYCMPRARFPAES